MISRNLRNIQDLGLREEVSESDQTFSRRDLIEILKKQAWRAAKHLYTPFAIVVGLGLLFIILSRRTDETILFVLGLGAFPLTTLYHAIFSIVSGLRMQKRYGPLIGFYIFLVYCVVCLSFIFIVSALFFGIMRLLFWEFDTGSILEIISFILIPLVFLYSLLIGGITIFKTAKIYGLPIAFFVFLVFSAIWWCLSFLWNYVSS